MVEFPWRAIHHAGRRLVTSRRALVASGLALVPLLIVVAWYVVASARYAICPSDQAPRVCIVSLRTEGTATGADIRVSVATSAPLGALEPASQTGDLHLVYLLDPDFLPHQDPPGLLPAGGPHVLHTAETTVTFPDVAPGTHLLVVLLAGPDGYAIRPPAGLSVHVDAGATGTPYHVYDEDSPQALLPSAMLLGALLTGLLAIALGRGHRAGSYFRRDAGDAAWKSSSTSSATARGE